MSTLRRRNPGRYVACRLLVHRLTGEHTQPGMEHDCGHLKPDEIQILLDMGAIEPYDEARHGQAANAAEKEA